MNNKEREYKEQIEWQRKVIKEELVERNSEKQKNDFVSWRNFRRSIRRNQ